MCFAACRGTSLIRNRWQAKNFVGRAVAYGDIIKLRHTKTKALLGIDIGRAPTETHPSPVIHKSMSLNYEPASEPLHISVSSCS